MMPSDTHFHGSTLKAHTLDGLLLVETQHPARSVVGHHAHEALTMCLPLAGGFEEVVGRARLAVVAPTVLVRAAGEPHADRFGTREARCFNAVLGRSWLRRHGLEVPP